LIDNSPPARVIWRAPLGSRKRIEAEGAELRFLPRCSPNLSPIDPSAN